MPVKLPVGWLVALNVLGWPAIHLGVAWIFTRLPTVIFQHEVKLLRPRAWEEMVYCRLMLIRLWKKLLPDAAPWLNGFAKRKLQSRTVGYLQHFVAETRRGEAAHWVMMLAGGLFFIWNPLWADLVMGAYAIIANLPCIVAQRYNRLRLQRLLIRNTIDSCAATASKLAR